jgi:hypothetical protein
MAVPAGRVSRRWRWPASASTYARVLPPNRPGSLEGNELALNALYCDPWNAMDFDVPLPDGLDLAALQSLRPIVYALLQALDLTLDEATGLIGRLIEIDRRIARMT